MYAFFTFPPSILLVQPSTHGVALGKSIPSTSNSYIASSAAVVGNVTIGQGSSVGYGAVVRGDVNSITIGNSVSIGDRAMIHCSGLAGNNPTKIGSKVIVGAGAIIHGAVLADESMVGAGAQILDTAQVQKHAIVAPGSLVASGKIVKSGQLWGGVPAAYIRDITDSEKLSISAKADENAEWATLLAKEAAKRWEEIDSDRENYEQISGRSDYYFKRLSEEEKSHKLGEFENHQVPGRVFDTAVSSRE
jgi:gamma-carbonic anhydrase